VVFVGTQVQLDGSMSYDLEGDPLRHQWQFLTRPQGSVTQLYGADTAAPSFVPDAKGTYEIRLIVSDPWDSGEDTVIVSFNNVKPVADAGVNQAVPAGTTVQLDGTGSTDANGDPLTFLWTLVSVPAGSTAALSGSECPEPTFFADVPGTYVVALVVNDGLEDSDPSTATVCATASAYAVTQVLMEIVGLINAIPPANWKNPNLQNALSNKINATLDQVDAGQFQEALSKLQNDILGKTDGCALDGEVDKNDWIKTCEDQGPVYEEVQDAIAYLLEML
jgi:hypothetical protein